ncbi:MAG: ABC transporter, partial [Actinobacteria bacterium]|nr:ABC transporter [Actinomycetota bacterium]
MVSPVRSLWQAMSAQRRLLALAALLGAFASLSAVALLGTSGWLISTAAEMPPVLTLTVAAVMVRFLALSRAIFRYGERLVGHDAAFRGLTSLRVTVYTNLERLAPTGLAAFGRGDLLTRLV